MTDDATPREVGSHAGLGLVPGRAAFEAWCCKRWAGDRNALTIRADGEYLNGHVQFAWAAWQASRVAERERCATVCEWVASSLESAEEDAQAMSTGAQSCADQIRAGA